MSATKTVIPGRRPACSRCGRPIHALTVKDGTLQWYHLDGRVKHEARP